MTNEPNLHGQRGTPPDGDDNQVENRSADATTKSDPQPGSGTTNQRRFKPEEIVTMLREAEVRLSHGERVGEICESFGVSEQSYYRWRRRYGGLRVDQARRMKQLERENTRLRKLVATLTLDRATRGEMRD